jgi:hypothetical protein
VTAPGPGLPQFPAPPVPPGPAAYQSAGVLPDPGGLADWMRKMLETSGGLLMFRRSADPYDHAEAYLKAEGVDVERELARGDREREHDRNRVRAAADRIRDLALDLKRAERDLLHESRGFSAGCAGFDRAKLAEARERAGQLRAALLTACCDDPELARSVRRQVA